MRLLAASIGVAAVLVALNYQVLIDHAGDGADRRLYDAIAEAEPAFEPRVVEPLVDPPDIWHGFYNTFGYTSAEHNSTDDSVTITYDYDGYMPPRACITCGEGAEGVHVVRYMPGQTFAYFCADYGDYTRVLLAQYRGTSEAHGAPSFVFVHFEVRIPEIIPCIFPDYLIHSVDAYDAGGLDTRYDLETYEEPPGGTPLRDVYAGLVRNPVIISPAYIDPTPIFRLDREHRIAGIARGAVHNPDDSLTVFYQDVDPDTREFVPGTNHTRTYAPGQTFLLNCIEHEDVTAISVYNYRGSELLHGSESIVLANFDAYTRVPMPCQYPDYLDYAADAYDAGRLDRQHDMEWYRILY